MSELSAQRPLRAVLLALGLTLGLGPALAPSAGAQASERKQRAAEFFNLGVKRFEAEEYQAALEAFEQAYRLAPHHAVRVNMAACFTELGRPVEALFNYERFLRESEGQAPPAQQKRVKEAMAELEKQVGEVKLEVSPPNATVHIDGKRPRRLPDGRVMLAEGSYIVEVFAPGYESYRGTLDVQGGQPSVLDVTLEPSPTGMQPPAEAATGAGQGEDSWSDFESRPSYEETPTWARPTTRRWIAGGGLALLAGGIVSGAVQAKANNDRDAARRRSMDPTVDPVSRVEAQLNAIDHQERADAARSATIALVTTGLALETAAFVLWLLDRNLEGDSHSAQVAPLLGPGHAGLALSGRF